MSVTIADYTSLITSEHNQQPAFVATVSLACQAYVDLQNVLLSLPGLYDLDVAAGVQLDAVGLWVGVSRFVPEPLTGVYFELDSDPLGLDRGYLEGPFDPPDGLVRLDDETYRVLLRARIIANHWHGKISDAMPALAELFIDSPTPDALIFIQDNMDMSMTFAIAGQSPGAAVLALLATNALGLKPTGVRVNYTQTSVYGAPIFGLDVENGYISGLDVGAFGIAIPT